MQGNKYFEVIPLRRGSQFGITRKHKVFKGPSRVIRLCILGILLPSLLIAVPLYLRYRVYRHQLYPLAISDMRIIDGRISTTWCQRQLLRANRTFNAFLLPETPQISKKTERFSMVRHLILEDDMKEYWGFYLLKDSVVRVFTCVRWPGSSLIVIRGHKHLHDCAYIGDNSSEEAEEQHDDGPANRPDEMRRHRPDVQFLQPPPDSSVSNKSVIGGPADTLDENMSDTEGNIKEILNYLQNKTKFAKKVGSKQKKTKHGHRNSTISSSEKENLKISPPHNSNLTSDEIVEELLGRLKKLGDKSHNILDKLKQKLDNSATEKFVDLDATSEITNRTKRELILETTNLLKSDGEKENVGREEGFYNPDGIAEHRGTFVETAKDDMSNSEFWSSFSSSEEALLSCTGLILNLPLTPHHKCSSNLSDEHAEETYLMNSITYKVPLNGYYFFVFNSENEVQQNYVRVKFDLEKAIYDVSDHVAACSNVSDNCSLDLKFFSSQKVVLELPVQSEEDDDNMEFVAESECEPRSALYAVCVIAVPVVFIMFAFT